MENCNGMPGLEVTYWCKYLHYIQRWNNGLITILQISYFITAETRPRSQLIRLMCIFARVETNKLRIESCEIWLYYNDFGYLLNLIPPIKLKIGRWIYEI